jgi:tetratricopeptide (TPR) repeat protein
VQAMLVARIGQLPPADERLLHVASVIGKDVPLVLLQAIAEEEAALRAGLSRLQAAEFLYETQLFPEAEYTFKHPLTHEVAYGSLAPERRRALHARLVEVIERVHADRLGEHTELVALHALRGEAWSPALVYLQQAAAKAIARGVYEEAATYLEQALEALRHLPETAETREEAIHVRLALQRALLPLGRAEAIVRYLREAETLAVEVDDLEHLAWIWAYLCLNLWLTDDTLGALAVGERALEFAERHDDTPLAIAASYHLGLVCLDSGSRRRAESLFEKIVRSLGDDLERFGLVGSPVIQSRVCLAWSLAERGQFGEARAQAREAFRLAERQNHAWNIIVTHWLGLGQVCAIQGSLDEAISHLESAAALTDEWSIHFLRPPVRATLAVLYARASRHTEGLSLREDAGTADKSAGWAIYSTLSSIQLAEARLLEGQINEARVAAEGALERCRRSAHRRFEAHALHLLGEIAAWRSSIEVEEGIRY